jgi:hypothetical protein
VKHLDYEDRSTIVIADVFHWADRFTAWPREPAVVLIAPPYAMFERRSEDLQQLWALLIDRLPDDTAIAIQAPEEFQRDSLPNGADWELRRYGQTQAVIGQTQKNEGANGPRNGDATVTAERPIDQDRPATSEPGSSA